MEPKLGCLGTGMLIFILAVMLGGGINLINDGFAVNKVSTIVFGVALALIPFLSLFGFLASKIGGRFRWAGVTKWIITLALSVTSMAAITMGVRNLVFSVRPDDEILQVFQDICSGNGVADAAGYQAGQVFPYHMILLKSSGEPDVWGSEIDESWKPGSIQEVNLVVCMNEKRSIHDNGCFYARSGQERDIRLVDAKTGEVIDSKTLTCGLPPCVLVKSGATDDSCIVRSSQVEGWVERSLGISEWWAELYPPVGVIYNTEGKKWGRLQFKVSPDIRYIRFEFFHFAMSEFACGSAALPVMISFLDEPEGTITDGQFELEFKIKEPGVFKISGSLDVQIPFASGTWEFLDNDGISLCSGFWESY